MVFELDQSGRVEETNKPTVVSIANKSDAYALIISAFEKREVFKRKEFKANPKVTKAKFFATLVYLVIKYSGSKVSRLVIDIEYPGYEKLISNYLDQRLGKFAPVIEFKEIGKASEAHFRAYGVYIGKIKPDLRIFSREVVKLLETEKAESQLTLRAVTRRHDYRDSQPTRHH